MYPDQDPRSVGTDLGTNCLQKLSADNKSHHWQEKSEETKDKFQCIVKTV